MGRSDQLLHYLVANWPVGLQQVISYQRSKVTQVLALLTLGGVLHPEDQPFTLSYTMTKKLHLSYTF